MKDQNVQYMDSLSYSTVMIQTYKLLLKTTNKTYIEREFNSLHVVIKNIV